MFNINSLCQDCHLSCGAFLAKVFSPMLFCFPFDNTSTELFFFPSFSFLLSFSCVLLRIFHLIFYLFFCLFILSHNTRVRLRRKRSTPKRAYNIFVLGVKRMGKKCLPECQYCTLQHGNCDDEGGINININRSTVSGRQTPEIWLSSPLSLRIKGGRATASRGGLCLADRSPGRRPRRDSRSSPLALPRRRISAFLPRGKARAHTHSRKCLRVVD